MKKILFFVLIIVHPFLFGQTYSGFGTSNTLKNVTTAYPSIYNGTAISNGYLYLAGDGKIYIYKLSEPGRPTYVKIVPSLTDVSRVWTGGNFLFVYSGTAIKIYDLIDPENPLLKSTYEAGSDLRKVSFLGGNMFILYMHESKYSKLGSLEIVSLSNSSSPQILGSYKASNYDGKTFFIPPSGNKMWVAHYNSTTKVGIISELDFSNPAAITVVRTVNTSGNPVEMAVVGNRLFVLKNTLTSQPSYLEAYDLDASPITQLATKKVSDKESWDMHFYVNSITVSCLETNGIKDFSWFETTKAFETGISIIQNNSTQITSYLDPATPSGNINSLRKTTNPKYYKGVYYYVQDWSSSSSGSDLIGTKIEIIYKQMYIKETVTKVTLNTSVFPNDASADGSTVIPSGSNQFDKNSTITLSAQAGTGWIFDKWTGNLSGSKNPETLLMDDDKNVVANFQPNLTLGLTSPSETNLCIPAQNEEVNIATASIGVGGVDWLFTGISFTAVEKFKPLNTEAWIEYAGKKLKGTISVDADSSATSFSFSPNQQINEGTTLSVKLLLKFNFPSKSTEKYIPAALTDVKKFKVSIQVGQITCVPIPESARPGVKGPLEIFYSNKQTMASVWNVSKQPNIPFATIKEAVESSQTLDNELIKLCPGWYVEYVKIPKSLTIFSSDGAEKTIIEKKTDEYQIFVIGKSNTKISGIHFKSSNNVIDIGDTAKKITACEIKESIFDNVFRSIYFSQNADSNFVHHNTIIKGSITLNASNYNRIEDNKFDGGSIALDANTNFNLIKNNILGNTTTAIKINYRSSETVKGNEIRNNYIGWDPNQKKIIPVENGIKISDGIEHVIEGNTIVIEDVRLEDCNEIELVNSSFNKIKNNICGLDTASMKDFPHRISLLVSKNSSYNEIESNSFVGNYLAGIAIKDASYENVIKKNFFGSEVNFVDELKLKHLRGGGIIVNDNCHSTQIDDNTFASLGVSVFIKSSNTVEITNNRFGCDKTGTKEVLTLTGIMINSSLNTISGNTFYSTSFAVMLSEESAKSNIIANNKFGTDITGSKTGVSGLGISLMAGANDNFIENNLFAGFNTFGVMIADPGTTRNYVQDNVFGLDYSFTKKLGIANGIGFYRGANENYILRNTICGADADTSCAILLGAYAHNNIIRENYLGTDKNGFLNIPNSHGIYAEQSNYNSFVQNKIWYNRRGVYEVSCNNIIAENDIKKCSANTGIHLKSSNSKIIGNNIYEDSFDAIKCENASNPIITGNNIFDNKGFGLNNADPNVKINAQGNFWGTSSLTINGNVNAANPLTTQSKLICTASIDTLFLPENGRDSVSVFYKNWNNASDKLSVTITSDKPNWITSSKNIIADLSQANSGESKIHFSLPAGTAKDEKSKVIIKAVSQTDQLLQMSDTLTTVVYKSVLSKITIRPDSTSCSVGDTIQLSIAAFDQHLNSLTTPTQIIWDANGGSITNDGKFIAGNKEGVFIITAKVSNTNITSSAKIKIGDITTDIKNETGEVIPTKFRLYNNYPNPFNPETTIKYDIPRQEYVILKIYDILGKEVALLINKEQPAGSYTVLFNSKKYNLASGMYIYKISAGSFYQSKKILLLK